MAKEYYHGPITDETEWNGDSSTGGLQVGGDRIQEWIKNKVSTLEDADEEISGRMVDVIETANEDHLRAESDHQASEEATASALEWSEHPPYIGDGRNGDKDYWYIWVNHEYVKSAYAKGDDIDWDTMTQEEYDRLVENVKQDLVFSSVDTCEDIVDELV